MVRKLSDKLVHQYAGLYEGDRFSLKDVDDGSPSGEYVCKAIRVQLYETDMGGRFTRVYVMDAEGRWVRDVNICNVRRW